MINRRNLLKTFSAFGLMAHHASQVMAQSAISGSVGAAKKGVMLMNRIGPSSSDLYIANADGTGERKLLQNAVFEYNASFAPDGKSVVFTSERNGAGPIGRLPRAPRRHRHRAAGHRPGGRRCGRALARRHASRLRLDAQRLPREHLGARSQERPDAQPDRRRGRAGRSLRPQRFLPAVMVAGRPVARVLVRPQHRLARPRATATAGSTRRSSASM